MVAIDGQLPLSVSLLPSGLGQSGVFAGRRLLGESWTGRSVGLQ
jgi:hypothetical protein